MSFEDLKFKLISRLLKGYSIFFFQKDTVYYVNDILIDTELKEIVLKYGYTNTCPYCEANMGSAGFGFDYSGIYRNCPECNKKVRE